jgi:hypothetical protein
VPLELSADDPGHVLVRQLRGRVLQGHVDRRRWLGLIALALVAGQRRPSHGELRGSQGDAEQDAKPRRRQLRMLLHPRPPALEHRSDRHDLVGDLLRRRSSGLTAADDF